MSAILLIKTGDTFPKIRDEHGDFEDMIMACIPQGGLEVTMYDARLKSPYPTLSDFDGVILTGSHAMVTDQEEWSEQLAPYIREMYCAEIPVLGICFGHQLIARAMGGKVAFHQQGIQIGTVDVHLSESGKLDPLIGQLPALFRANVGHQQSVQQLPEGAVLLAYNASESHESFRVGQHMWGVQFHPEFTQGICQQYIECLPQALELANKDAKQVLAACVDTPESRRLIQYFVDYSVGVNQSN